MSASHPGPRAGRSTVPIRLALVACASIVAYSAAKANESLRAGEAQVVGLVAGLFSRSDTLGVVVFAGLGGPRPIALTITPECTSALLMLPLLGAFCFYVLYRGVRVSAALIGLLAGALLVFAINEARIELMLASWFLFGEHGFWLAHEVIGSVVSVVSVLVALLLQLRLTASRGHSAEREF